MKPSIPLKLVLVFLTLLICISIDNVLEAQNLELLLKGKEDTEKDLWKKDRLNYYLDSREINEDYPESFFYRGQEKLREGLYDKAIVDLKKAIANERLPSTISVSAIDRPTKRAAYLSISFCFQQLDEVDSALYYCQKSIFEDDYFIEAYIQKALLLSYVDRFADAIEFLNKADLIFPISKKIYFTKAQIYLQHNKMARAKRNLTKAIKIDPDFDEANVLLATLYISSYDVKAAMNLLTNSINKGKKPITSLYFRAMIYMARNELALAYEDLKFAYNLDSIDNPVTSRLFMLDYYYENYPRANKIVYDLWIKAMTKDSIMTDRISYRLYEYGYFLKCINEGTADETGTENFNSLMTSTVHQELDPYIYRSSTKTLGFDMKTVEEYAKNNVNSLFANRLHIYSYWVHNKFYLQIGNEFITRDFADDKIQDRDYPNYSKQIRDINYVIYLDSSITSMYWCKSTYEYQQGEYEKAVKTATQGILLDSSYFEPYKIRAICNIKLENYQAAIDDLNKLIESGFSFSKVGTELAYSYYKLGRYEEALEINTKVLNYRSDINAITNQGLCYEMNNHPDSAILYFTIASLKYPTHSEYTKSIARIHTKEGNYEEALKVLKKANSQTYSDFMLLVDIADLYVLMEDFESAITYYKKSYREDKDYTYGYLGAADCYRKLGEHKAAIRLYDIAISKKPEHAYSYYAKGLCFFDLKDYGKSGEAAYEAINLNNEYADAYELMANSYFLLGRYSVSISMGYNAVKYNPENKKALYQLAASILAKGDVDQASGLYQDIFETEDEIKSSAYDVAIETLEYMIANNIQAEAAKVIQETVLGRSDL